MSRALLYKIIHYCIAAIWLINGLYCKVLHQSPRHKEIVAAILGNQYASTITVWIGIAEIGMATWIVSGFKSKANAITQIIVIGAMNLLEFFMASELLLWGRMNLLFAFLLMVIIYYNEFQLKKSNPPIT